VSQPLLDVQNLHVQIPTERGVVRAVDDVSFPLAEGEALGLVGESGCGKTSTLKAIVGLLPRSVHITEGRILFAGQDLAAMRESQLRDVRGRSISMIFQEPMTALNPMMRVGTQIAEVPRVALGYSRAQANERAVDLMRRVGIPDPDRRARSFPHELSGGMRQRVMIAIALSCEPKIILCDEPTTALDVTIQDQILKILASLQQEEGLSLVYVSHDLAVIAQLCQRVAVMYAGQIVETGLVSEVFYQPRHPYTLGLLRAVPSFERVRASLTAIPGTPPDLADRPSGCPFHPRCPYQQEDCLEGEFPLIPLESHRATACIHPSACIDSLLREPVITGA
jgi:oligopeptide/dipeptide ABC transporter ATP-binding protein